MTAENLEMHQKKTGAALHVYGPGGPLKPMQECAKIFSEKAGLEVRITTGTPPQWIEQAKQNGDLIFEGAEYMLNDFMKAYPGLVDESTITGLYARSAAILVRKGNPKGIRTLHDLAHDSVKVMVVTQENMDEVYRHIPGIQYNIVLPVLTGAQAARTWTTTTELDAWVTYESWHHALKDETDLVELQNEERILRVTPVAVMRMSKHATTAAEFVDFLKSDEAHRIFRKWGWK